MLEDMGVLVKVDVYTGLMEHKVLFYCVCGG